jgi:hypothetical protein
MPITYEIDHEHRIIMQVFRGVIRNDEFLKFSEQVFRLPEFNAGYSEFADFSDGNLKNISSETLQQSAALSKSMAPDRSPNARLGIYAPEDFNYGISRMFQLVNDAPDDLTRVFRDLDQALAWLREP